MAKICDDTYRANNAKKEAAREEYQTCLSHQKGLDVETATKLVQPVHIQEEVAKYKTTKEETEDQ